MKPVLGGEGWMKKLIRESHNHALAKLLVRHPYVDRLTINEKIIIGDMIKLIIKSKNCGIEGAKCYPLYNNKASNSKIHF